MPVTAKLYGNFLLTAASNEFTDLNGSTKVYASLHTATYTPDQDADDHFDDVSDELVDASYPAGGVVVPGVTVSRTNKVVTLDCDPIVFNNLSGTFRYMILRDTTTAGAANQPLIGYVDFGGNLVPAAQDFTVTPHASGISTHTAA